MFGEIQLCQFPFTDGIGSKIRPVLVLFELQDDAIICRVTSARHTTSFDVELTDWQEAGLLKPSTVRLGHLLTVEKKIFVRRLGILSSFDANAIKQKWNQSMII